MLSVGRPHISNINIFFLSTHRQRDLLQDDKRLTPRRRRKYITPKYRGQDREKERESEKKKLWQKKHIDIYETQKINKL